MNGGVATPMGHVEVLHVMLSCWRGTFQGSIQNSLAGERRATLVGELAPLPNGRIRAQLSGILLRLIPESACEGFFVKNTCRTTSHLHLHIFTSAHPHSHLYLCSSSHLHSQLHIYISAHLHILTSTSLLIFIFTHVHLCSCSHLHIDISAHLHILISTSHIFTSHLHLTSSPLALLNRTLACISRPRHARSPQRVAFRGGPAALSGATLRGDRARRGREMQARVRFGPRSPLRRSCVSTL